MIKTSRALALVLFFVAPLIWAPSSRADSLPIDEFIRLKSKTSKDEVMWAEMLKIVFHEKEISHHGLSVKGIETSIAQVARETVAAKITMWGERRMKPGDVTSLQSFRDRLPNGPELAWVLYQIGDNKAAEKMFEEQFSVAHKAVMGLKVNGRGGWGIRPFEWPPHFFVRMLRELVDKKRYTELNEALGAEGRHRSRLPHIVG